MGQPSERQKLRNNNLRDTVDQESDCWKGEDKRDESEIVQFTALK